MKRILIKIIHYFKPHYFESLTYNELEQIWGIKDVVLGVIYFKN